MQVRLNVDQADQANVAATKIDHQAIGPARSAHKDPAADAALASLVIGHQVATKDAGAAAQPVQLAQLEPPKVPADDPGVVKTVLQGVEHEQERQSELSENPGVAIAVGSLLQQFSGARPAAGAHDTTQSNRVGDVGTQSSAAASSAGSLFGDSVQDQMVAVMLQVTQALQKDRQGEVQMQGKMAMISRQAAQSQADSLVRQGNDMLAGAVSGGVLQGSMATMGGVQQFRGLNTRASSIENKLKPAAQERLIDRSQMAQLRGKDMPVLSEHEASRVSVKQQSGEVVDFSIDGSGGRLSAEHETVLSEDRAARQHKIEMHGLDHESNLVVADRQRLTGSLIDTAGAIAKNQADAISGMEQNRDRAVQTMAQSTEQVATTDANARHESAQQLRDMMQKMHEVAMQVNNNNAAVAGAIAGNLKS
ncbi:hypothetical protein WJ60_06310 [Burkholderia ubonensis]|nr:hypothetical protein WJ60_06310 [Burkholderia ubonensis]